MARTGGGAHAFGGRSWSRRTSDRPARGAPARRCPGSVAGQGASGDRPFTPAQCEVRASGQSFTWAPDQANTAVITAIAIRRGLPPRAATIAIATGHPGVQGPQHHLWRSRLGRSVPTAPVAGWGTVEQIMNPEYPPTPMTPSSRSRTGRTPISRTPPRRCNAAPTARHTPNTRGKARVTASVLAGYPRRDRLPPRGADNGPQRIRRRRPDQPGPRARPGGGDTVVLARRLRSSLGRRRLGCGRAIDTGSCG